MRYYEISNVAFIIYFSVLAIVILYSLFPPTLINSQPEIINSSSTSLNKCAGYHTSYPSDAGISVGGNPFRLSIDPTTNMVYVVDKFSKKVSFIDGMYDKVVRTTSLTGIEPSSVGFNRSNLFDTRSDIAIDPTSKLLYVTSSDSSLLYILDSDSGNIISNVTLNGSPYGVNANNTVIYVITSDENPTFTNSTAYMFYQYYNRIYGESPTMTDAFEALDVDYRSDSNDTLYVIGQGALYLFNKEFNPNLDEPIRYLLNQTVEFPLDPFLEDVAINHDTNMAYMAADSEESGDVLFALIALNMSSGNVTNLPINGFPTAVVLNPNTNSIYVAALTDDSSRVLAINGTANCLMTEIPVGAGSRGLTIDTARNMIYVANMLSGTVSAINGTTDSLSAVVRFNVNPPNSGYIQCDGKRLQQNFTRYDVGTNLSCEARAYGGYSFSAWTGDLVPTTFSRDPNINGNTSIELTVSKYGSLNANFITSPPPPPLIPEQFWVPLYGIIPAVIVSTFIPSLIQRNKEKKISKRHLEYYSALIGKTDHDELEKEFTQLYREGKINESDYRILKDRIDHNGNASAVHTGSPIP